MQDKRPVCRALFLGLALFVGLLFSGSCSLLSGGRQQEAELAEAIRAVAQPVLDIESGEEMAVLGFRNAKGERDIAAEVIEDHLVSDLVEADVPLVWAEEQTRKWSAGNAIPQRHWEDLETPWALGGRFHTEGDWVYLRLFVIDTQSGAVLERSTSRLAAADLERQVAQREQGGEVSLGPVQADVHLLILRDEGGFPQQVELADGGALQTEDRLQLRVTLGTDSHLYAFLYDEDGQVQQLLANQLIYSGRIQYGPGAGEEDWLTLKETDQVYTLYLLVARRLDEDTSDLFEKMSALIDEGQVERFVGLAQQDVEIGAYVQRSMGLETSLRVERDPSIFEQGDEESIIFADGTLIKSSPMLMEGEPALIWALSFKVE